MSIRVDDAAQQNGIALMLADLIGQNLEQHPERRRVFESLRGQIGISACDEDSRVEVTLSFQKGSLEIRDGLAAGLSVHVTSDYETVLALTQIPLIRGRVPDLASPGGREMARNLIRRRLKIRGAALHLRLLWRLLCLLSVNEVQMGSVRAAGANRFRLLRERMFARRKR